MKNFEVQVVYEYVQFSFENYFYCIKNHESNDGKNIHSEFVAGNIKGSLQNFIQKRLEARMPLNYKNINECIEKINGYITLL